LVVKFQSVTEQVACHLREELLRGRWKGLMPGRARLAEELSVSGQTVILALERLEKEGVLRPQGKGRRRMIVARKNQPPRALRVSILLYEKDEMRDDYMVDLLHRLQEEGHEAGFAQKTLVEMRMDTQRVTRLVNQTEADAWIIRSGSREILEWFAGSGKPAFALAGRRTGIPMAGGGPDKVSAQRLAMRRLFELGHRRIVMLAREERRKPHPGLLEREFLADLEACGVRTGSYNLPEWKDSPEGFHRCLDSLFRHSPPTALICQEMPHFFAAQQHLAQQGILTPRDVSMFCQDPHPAFAWCQPSVAHISWDPRPLVRRIVRWTNNMACGNEDRRQSVTTAKFIEGGTIGPAPANG
jgi:DNA-binding LacI/PurR family transcriptional regulator